MQVIHVEFVFILKKLLFLGFYYQIYLFIIILFSNLINLNHSNIFREDLLKKMQRHTIVPLVTNEDSPDITEQIVQSILDQVILFNFI